MDQMWINEWVKDVSLSIGEFDLYFIYAMKNLNIHHDK